MTTALRAWEDGDITEYLRIPRYPVVGLITSASFARSREPVARLVLLSRRGEMLTMTAPYREKTITETMTEALIRICAVLVLAFMRMPLGVAWAWSASSVSPILPVSAPPFRAPRDW